MAVLRLTPQTMIPTIAGIMHKKNETNVQKENGNLKYFERHL